MKSYFVMNNLSIKKINIITTNVTSTASINLHSKKVRDCYILHTVLLAILLLLILAILLLIVVSICCILIKYKKSIYYNFTNNKQVLY